MGTPDEHERLLLVGPKVQNAVGTPKPDDHVDGYDDLDDDDDHVAEPPSTGLVLSAFNLTNTVVGGGVVSLPYAFKSSGLVIGSAVLIFTFVLSSISLWLLRVSARESGVYSYQGIGEYGFGRRGVYLSEAVKWAATAGVTISYFILIGDFMYPLVQEAAPDHLKDNFVTSRQFIALMTVVVETPLILLRDIGKLSYMSTVAVLAVLYLVTVVVLRSVQLIDRGGFEECTGGYCFDFGVFTTGLFRALPLLTFAFTCQFNYFPIRAALVEPTMRRQAIFANLSLGMCALLYMLIASFGYFTFYEKVNDNFLINYDNSDPLIVVARVAMTVVIVCSYPLLSHPSIEGLHNVLFYGQRQSWRLRCIYASVYLFVDCLVAWFNPDVSIVFGLVGATFSTMISFILPGMWYIGTMRKKTGRYPTNVAGFCAWILIGFGTIFMCIGTVVTLIPDKYLDPVPNPESNLTVSSLSLEL